MWGAQRCLHTHCNPTFSFVPSQVRCGHCNLSEYAAFSALLSCTSGVPQVARVVLSHQRLRAVHADHWPELALSEVANQVRPTSFSCAVSGRPLCRPHHLFVAQTHSAPENVFLQVEGVRCRQHANPLRKELQVQLPPQDWSEKFADPGRPLIVDVGCGPGRFLLALSRSFQGHNMLGLDIREKVSTQMRHYRFLTEEQFVSRAGAELTQLIFMSCAE